MNQKTQRKYELIRRIGGSDSDTLTCLTEICDIDYQTGFEMWEYALGLGKDVVAGGFDIFLKSETKFRQLFCESLPLQKLVYTSKQCICPQSLNFLASLIIANKIDDAKECLAKMTQSGNDFGDALKLVLETTFAQYCKKNNVKVPVFNKKQKELFKTFIEKVKGPNKALLTQRIKEI
jgi:hypothetical protein